MILCSKYIYLGYWVNKFILYEVEIKDKAKKGCFVLYFKQFLILTLSNHMVAKELEFKRAGEAGLNKNFSICMFCSVAN